VAEPNQTLYKILVDKLKTERGDVIRVRIDCDVSEAMVKWFWNILKNLRKTPDEEVSQIVGEAPS